MIEEAPTIVEVVVQTLTMICWKIKQQQKKMNRNECRKVKRNSQNSSEFSNDSNVNEQNVSKKNSDDSKKMCIKENIEIVTMK